VETDIPGENVLRGVDRALGEDVGMLSVTGRQSAFAGAAAHNKVQPVDRRIDGYEGLVPSSL